jgi:hypothetical protein
MMRTYPLSQQLLQALVSYLQTRPWIEVNAMLLEIRRVVEATDAPGPLPDEAPKSNGQSTSVEN